MNIGDKILEYINFRPEVFKEESLEIQKIADNYAIEFAEYIYARPNIFNNGSSIKQVLSLFKIEKNL